MASHQFLDLDNTPIPERRAEECRIYIRDIPVELNTEGLVQLFSDYGSVKSVLFPKNATWAYITYEKHAEAERAIRSLHQQLPLNLHVSLAQDKKPTDPRRIASTGLKSPFIPLKDDKISLSIPSSIESNISQNSVVKNLPPAYTNSLCTFQQNLQYPVPIDNDCFNPYEAPEKYGDTNNLWTRGNVTVTKDGRKHVSFGRGYVYYELPAPDPAIESYINKVYEKRTKDIYVHGVDELSHNCGKCLHCGKATIFTCQRCMAFYCTRDCQISDWHKHRSECQPIPPLVKLEEAAAITNGNSNTMISFQPLRRPKKFDISATKESVPNGENLINKTVAPLENLKASNQPQLPLVNLMDNVSITTNSEIIQAEHKNNQIAEKHKNGQEQTLLNCSKVSENFDTPPLKNMYNRNSSSLQNESTDNSNKIQAVKHKTNVSDEIKPLRKPLDAVQVEESLGFRKLSFLPDDTFVEVQIIISEDNGYWVQKLDNWKKFEDMSLKLQEVAEKSQKAKPQLKNLYAIKFKEMWYRVVVLELNPTKVRFVDYGHTEVITQNDFYLIEEFKAIPGFAKKIRIINAKPNQKRLVENDVISVKKISINADSNIINVEIKEEHEIITPSNTVLSLPQKKEPDNFELKSVMDILQVDTEGLIQIHEITDNIARATLLPTVSESIYEKLLYTLPEECKKMEGRLNKEAKINDLICGKREEDGEWFRGYIKSLGPPIKLSLVDEAREMGIVEVAPYPEKFNDLYTLGVICQVKSDSTVSLAATNSYQFKVLKCNKQNSEFIAEIQIQLEDNTKTEVMVKAYKHFTEQKKILYAKLKSGSKVCIASFRSQKIIYLRPLDPNEVERYTRLMQKVSKYASELESLRVPPVVGQMVLSKYIDNNYYRGVVKQVEKQNALVCYIDFGNFEFCSFKELKPLPEELQIERSCAVKITLKGVASDVPMTKETSDYLTELTGTETPIICTFDDGPEVNSVVLKLENGQNLNEKLHKMLTEPSWTKPDDNQCYMVSDLPACSLGKVGDTTNVMVLATVEEGVVYIMGPMDREITSHIFDLMPELLKKHCENTDHYIPRQNELCLAFHGNKWYRAVCLDPKIAVDTAQIFFVDHGNVDAVKHTNLRLMVRDFMSPEALGNICSIKDFGQRDSSGQYAPELLKRLTQLMKDVVRITIVSFEGDGAYCVDLPDIRATLIKENLLKTM
ncbi:uncharacterized protein [Prorops nasuta]|uniref:uncharacterized protein n=1 Tax=Prorops nasuta TaxID=863751 RepID=UPI0034CDD53E